MPLEVSGIRVTVSVALEAGRVGLRSQVRYDINNIDDPRQNFSDTLMLTESFDMSVTLGEIAKQVLAAVEGQESIAAENVRTLTDDDLGIVDGAPPRTVTVMVR